MKAIVNEKPDQLEYVEIENPIRNEHELLLILNKTIKVSLLMVDGF